MTPKERFKGHFEFLDQLDEAIDAALKQYHDAKESDLEELRHLQREAGLARRTLAELCTKFATPIGNPVSGQDARAQAPATPQHQAGGEKSAAGA